MAQSSCQTISADDREPFLQSGQAVFHLELVCPGESVSAQTAQDTLSVGISPLMLSLGCISQGRVRVSEVRTTEWESHLWDGSDGSDKFVCQRPQLREICHCVEIPSPGILLSGRVCTRYLNSARGCGLGQPGRSLEEDSSGSPLYALVARAVDASGHSQRKSFQRKKTLGPATFE